jgi:hypothetical protein
VDARGQARLEQIKPGVYQVTRVFRVKKEALPLKAGGRWQNNEVVVTVAAGKEVSVPPLVWASPPPASPKR